MTSAGLNSAWTRTYEGRADAAVRLFCFPYAGASASVFRTWHTALPEEIEPVAIQLPGRDDRFDEPAYEHMTPLVADLADVLSPLLDKPYACYGFSMGARVALALLHELRHRGLPAPKRLFVASSAAPALRRLVRGWDEPEEGLVAYLRELGGTPPELFDNPGLLALFLPSLRADLSVVGTCPIAETTPLDVPIRAFAGDADVEAPPARMRDWARETNAEFELTTLAGSHFFPEAETLRMMRIISADLLT
ncbi:thioesterase II family protein [Micromonospora arborensis]|uniref:thioesterase II family protein n=1 Tax=Micromonospora arborensis TaxID=2116518 RepID=UPI00142E20BD|nr:thioesterase domain-containing protein [Micromonospora arborensis]